MDKDRFLERVRKIARSEQFTDDRIIIEICAGELEKYLDAMEDENFPEFEIKEISIEELNTLYNSRYDERGEEVIEFYSPRGLFICQTRFKEFDEYDEFNTVNNSTGSCIVNVFGFREDAEEWLRKNTLGNERIKIAHKTDQN